QPYVAAFATLFAVSLVAGIIGVGAQWRRAETNATIARTQLWDSREKDALRLMESGDGWNAAPLLLANIREMEAQRAADRLAGTRKRLGIIVNNNPRVIDAWRVGQNAIGMAFAPDGKQLAVTGDGRGVRFFDVGSGKLAFELEGKKSGSLL